MKPHRRVTGPGAAAVLLAVCTAALAAAAPTSPRIAQFSPQGTVQQVRQVTARFSAPMVPFGAPRDVAAPFEIECAEPGTGRWVDSRTWAYDFARDLPGGLRCTFQLRAGVKSLAGKAVTGERRFAFSTGGPTIQSSRPADRDNDIDEEQAFVLVLNAEPSSDSLLANVSFAVDGIAERVGVRVIDGEARAAILKTLWKGLLSGPAVVVQATQRFPSGAKVRLIWSKGVAGSGGVTSERDQVLQFTTRKAFHAQFYCERENARANCIPLTPMRVSFSAPVAWEQAQHIALVGADGQRRAADGTHRAQTFVRSVEFKGPFAEAASFRVELPADLHDDGGRRLANAGEYPLTVKTDPFPPLAKFSARFGIIESKAEPVLPVTLRNLEPAVQTRLQRVTGTVARISPEHLEEILPWLRKVGGAKRGTSLFTDATPSQAKAIRSFSLPKPNGAKAFEVVGIPLEAPGLYVVELASPNLGAALLGTPRPMFVPAAALVTNLSVHFKWGRENALAWVTTLDAAQPVAGARVSVLDCRGTVRWSGSSDAQGVARISGLPARDALPRCYEPSGAAREDEAEAYNDTSDAQAVNPYSLSQGLLVAAQTDDDMSFVHSEWEQGIEPWRFQLPSESWQGPIVAHTIFDRPLFRAGETVHMKHLLRQQSLEGFSLPPDGDRPTLVSIRHEGSNEKYELPVQWDAAGSAETTWQIPKEAKLGRYQVVLTREGGNAFRDARTSGSFRVEEFRVPLMRGVVQLPAEPQVAATQVPVDLTVQYLAGGAAGNLPVQLRAQIRPKTFQPPDEFEHFAFGNGLVKEGIVRRGTAEDETGETTAKPGVHQRQELVLDANGAAHSTITDLPPAMTPRELLTEMELRDPNGETQTVSAAVPLWPAQWLVGVKNEEWVSSKRRVETKLAVVDVKGRPIADAAVHVDIRQRKTYSHRKRLVGGFYAYEHVEEISPVLSTLCDGKTGPNGLLLCDAAPPADGNLIVQATATDGAGHTTAAWSDTWVPGPTSWRFRTADSDRIDLLPERPRYEPGETARLQVRMPFREATALVTTEREGILDAVVVPLSGNEPVVEVPVKGTDAPNIFVSVLVVRGRIGDVQPTAMVDLGKPAFKLGIAEIRVGWRAHELKVAVNADRSTYTVRERAAVKIAVRTADGAAPPPGSEVAVAAVDEGLLELQPNTSWNVLDALMGRRGYSVRTASAQMQVVGKRHYGLKALPQGGGGGRQTTRELFDTLLLWNGRVALDAAGDASVEVPLNDALTSFRIVAVATGGAGQFGTGSTAIRSTQDLMLLAGIPPLVREGDRLRAEFTLRNTTSRALDVTVAGRVEGSSVALNTQTLAVAPGEAKVVGWDIEVPVGVSALRYDVEANAAGGPSDHLRVTQQVRPVVPVRTYQATLLQWAQPIREAVERPADALAGRGGVRVDLAPTLSSGLNGVRDWIRGYPYSCLEQRVSRAVVLNDATLWQEVAAALPSYVDGDGLLKYFPTMRSGSDVLTSYVLAITQERGFAVPTDVQKKMEDGLRKFVNGSIRREPAVRAVDLPLRKLAAVAALARCGKADANLLGGIGIEPNLWPTSAVLDWWSILSRLPGIRDRDRRLRETEQIVRARLNLQGTTMGFSTERSDTLWWLMVCPDTNAVRLILQLLDLHAWQPDLPRLLRGALARQQRGTWDCTVTDAWGTLAVEKFSQAFEATPVTGTTTATLAASVQPYAWPQPPQAGTLPFEWPAQRAELRIEHSGSGSPWITVQSQAAIPLSAPLSSGYRITKTLTPLEPRTAGRLSRGDRVRVHLEIEAQSDMTWVVVNDPVPAGASHLGTGLARDSQLATQGESHDDGIWPSFEERAFDAYRAYYDFVPKGTFVSEYTIRLNQSGHFLLPATRVEALYAPEMFGELPNAPLEVDP